MTGAELRALRIGWELTQEELGKHIGISASAVAHLESGKNTMSKPVAILINQILLNHQRKQPYQEE